MLGRRKRCRIVLLFRVGVGGLLTAFTLAGFLGATLVFPELVGFRCYPLNPITGCALTGKLLLAAFRPWRSRYISTRGAAALPNFPNSNHHAIRIRCQSVSISLQWTGCQVIDS